MGRAVRPGPAFRQVPQRCLAGAERARDTPEPLAHSARARGMPRTPAARPTAPAIGASRPAAFGRTDQGAARRASGLREAQPPEPAARGRLALRLPGSTDPTQGRPCGRPAAKKEAAAAWLSSRATAPSRAPSPSAAGIAAARSPRFHDQAHADRRIPPRGDTGGGAGRHQARSLRHRVRQPPAAQGQHLSRPRRAGGTQPAGRLRRIWRQPARLPRLRRDPPDYYQIPVADRQRLLEMQRAEADEDAAARRPRMRRAATTPR